MIFQAYRRPMDSWVLVKYIKLKRVFDEQVQVVHGIYDL